MSLQWRAVLFDLDGTLIDSAPDLAGAANDLRAAQGLKPLPYEQLRPMVGAGARGMLGAALGAKPQDANFESLREDFLFRYERRMTQLTKVFSDMVPIIDRLVAGQYLWGIVTNKAERFAVPLIRLLELDTKTSTLICGDTTPHSKPHPAPLLEAARQLGVSPVECIYVGDDLRDVQAGHAAEMRTIAVSWGYLGEGAPINAWGADYVIHSPNELLNLLKIA